MVQLKKNVLTQDQVNELLGVDNAPAGAEATGHIQEIDVRDIRRHFGDQWDDLSDKVHRQIHAALNRHLSQADFYNEPEELLFVVIFRDLSHTEAAMKAQMLREQILEKLLGAATVAELSGDPAKETTKSDSDESTLSSILAELSPRLAAIRQELDGMQDIALDPAKLDGQLKRLNSVAQVLKNTGRLLGRAIAANGKTSATHLKTEAVPAEAAEQLKEKIAALLLDVEQELTQRLEAAAVLQADANEDKLEFETRFDYLPLWSAKKQVVSTYICRVKLVHGNALVSPDRIFHATRDGPALATVDRLVLRNSLIALHMLAGGDLPNVVGVPVHLSTLMRAQSQRQYAELCSRIPEKLRHFISWEIVGIEGGTWQSQLASAAGRLCRFGRGVVICLDIHDREFGELHHHAIQAVGVDLAKMTGKEADILQSIENFAAAAQKQKLQVYVKGVKTLSLAVGCIAAGVDFLAGEAITGTADNPWGIMPYETEKLFLNLITDSF